MTDTPRFADLPAVPYMFVRTKLPEGGLEELYDITHTPLLNVAMGQVGSGPIPEGMFPLSKICFMASDKNFLGLLGKPLAVDRELESRPGIWWLSTADGNHHAIIFSDSYRKNAWKGGQICVSTSASGRSSATSLPVLALAKTFEALFGPQPAYDPTNMTSMMDVLGEDNFVAKALAANPTLSWPKWSESLPQQDLTILAKSARSSVGPAPRSARP